VTRKVDLLWIASTIHLDSGQKGFDRDWYQTTSFQSTVSCRPFPYQSKPISANYSTSGD
jgi:hypothetical protein